MSDVTNFFTTEDLLSGNDALQLFQYTQEEADDFAQGFDPSYIKDMHVSVSSAINQSQSIKSNSGKIDNIIQILKQLTTSDLNKLDKLIYEFTESNPNMLWNMLNKADKEYYVEPDKFYSWLSTLSDKKLDQTIFRVADGKKIHHDDIYNRIHRTPKVEILDGYIAITSSNLDALDRFKERVLRSNEVTFEHRIKKHGNITMHSYIFKMD
tara:strand:+ start:103 stop:732 length:630 start_codon:yes stop_codon:yes gene_type:complete